MREFVEQTQAMGRANAESTFAKSRAALRMRYLAMRVMRLKPHRNSSPACDSARGASAASR
ncbi:hypothetical protein [Amycolatopsis sp. WAC 01375]|uniref:hypothetical protein n=1 Tax=Amycolatopsis sp. WAC 01375 TaxID=2203194 RepID=UPI0018F35B3A|nr:hypothetical protein [Amycolatopsis sp. WAC 01375]